MSVAPVSLGIAFSLIFLSVARADEPGAADAPSEQPVTGAAGAAAPETNEAPAAPQPQAAPEPQAQPAQQTQAAPEPQPQAAQQQPRFRRWTPEEIARVRAALARQREQVQHRAERKHGDPRARYTLGFDVTAAYRPDVGFERFEGGHWSPRFGIFVGMDLVRINERLAFFAELGGAIDNDESHNLLGSGSSAELSSQTLQLGLGLRWEALSWLSPQVRLSGGASLFQLDVKGTNVAFDTGHATSVLGALGAGFIVHTPARAFESDDGKLASFRLGLLVEAGYALRSSVDFDLRTQSDPRRIEVVDAKLGSLSLSGGYLRFAALLRF